MSYSIIIPTRNEANLRACVESIRAHQDKVRIIVVDDGLKFGTGGPEDWAHLRVFPAFDLRSGLKPFIFARNINLGIAAAGDDDVILLNDDTRLLSDLGFGYLSAIANENPQYGIISAGITGAVGNTEQIAQPGTRLREAKHHTLVFVCVYLRRVVLNDIADVEKIENDGTRVISTVNHNRSHWLDERFIGYGYDDDSACEMVRRCGYKLGIFDGCVVEHGVLESSYRGNHGNTGLSDLEPNRKRFIEKWGFAPGQAPQRMQPESGAAHRKVEW